MRFLHKLRSNILNPFMILLILSIIVGAFVRIWKITTLPFPPNGDELAFGYYGWSLLHFGTDEYGTFFPGNFPSIGDYKYPGLAYFNIIPAAIFGLSEIISRFWSVISGIIFIPLTYLIVIYLFNNKTIALIAAWIIALSPWSIVLSRLGYENQLAQTLTLAGFVSLLSLRKLNKRYSIIIIITTVASFILASFTYAASRLFIPLMLASILSISLLTKFNIINIKQKFSLINSRYIVLFLVIIASLSGISLLSWQNRGRAEAVMWKGLSSEQSNRLQELYVEAGISPIKIPVKLTLIFHNKIRISVEDFLYRYTNHFSPKFLFFEGEAATERIPDTGMLPLLLIIFLPIGLLTLLTFRDKQVSLFILSWLAISPLPSALTFGEPHINRASLMIPSLAVISAFGLWQTINIFSNKMKFILSIIISILFFFNSLYILNQLFIQKPVNKPWVSEQVNKLLANEVFALKEKYKAIAIPKDEYIYFLFYGKISPIDFLKSSSIKPALKGNSWDRVEKIDNIYFNMAFDCPKSGKLNVLYICKGENIPQNSKIIKVIRYWDNVPAYTLLEFIPISIMPKNLPALPERLKYMVDLETNPQIPDGIIPEQSPKFW